MCAYAKPTHGSIRGVKAAARDAGVVLDGHPFESASYWDRHGLSKDNTPDATSNCSYGSPRRLALQISSTGG